MIERFSDKDPLEAIVLSVDFTPVLDGETITSQGWTITREDLPTEVTTGMLSGACSLAGNIVSQKVIDGTVGGDYIHRPWVQTANRKLVYGVRQTVTFGA